WSNLSASPRGKGLGLVKRRVRHQDAALPGQLIWISLRPMKLRAAEIGAPEGGAANICIRVVRVLQVAAVEPGIRQPGAVKDRGIIRPVNGLFHLRLPGD